MTIRYSAWGLPPGMVMHPDPITRTCPIEPGPDEQWVPMPILRRYAQNEDDQVRKLTEERDALHTELGGVREKYRAIMQKFIGVRAEAETLHHMLGQLCDLTAAEDYSQLFLLVADKFPPQPEPHVPDLGFERGMVGQTRVRVGR